MVYTMPALVLEALMKRTKKTHQNILLKRKESEGDKIGSLRHIIFMNSNSIFFISKNDLENQQEFRIGLVLIHIFSKYATLIPTKSKQPPDVFAGLMEGLQKMGKKPEASLL